jgi:hypothetical protein
MTLLFIEKTWYLWWMFAVIVIVRWFHVSCGDVNSEDEGLPIAKGKDGRPDVRSQLASRV